VVIRSSRSVPKPVQLFIRVSGSDGVFCDIFWSVFVFQRQFSSNRVQIDTKII